MHADGAVDLARLHQDGVSLADLAAEEGKLGLAGLGLGDLLDVAEVVHLVHLVDGGVRQLRRVEVLALDSHGRQARPAVLALGEAAQPQRLLPLLLADQLLQQTRVRRHLSVRDVSGSV